MVERLKLRTVFNGGRYLWQKYLSRLVKEFIVFAPVGLGLILLLNIMAPKNAFEGYRNEVLANSLNSQARIGMARLLEEANQWREAEKLLRPIDSRPDSAFELRKISEARTQPEKIREDILTWQKVADQLPNYRDAMIKLAILNWKIYREFEAKKFLEKALEVDPNSEVAERLLGSLK